MEKVIRKLRLEFCLVFAGAAVLAGLFESGVWPAGWAAGNAAACYYLDLAGIAAVVTLVPAALKVMSLRTVRRSFAEGSAGCSDKERGKGYGRWSAARLAMLAAAGWTNIAAYYLTLDTTGSFCALIAALALCFCWPSRGKFLHEAGADSNPGGTEGEKRGGA